MPKTDIEKEMLQLILNDCGQIRTKKTTWHEGKWVDVTITYDICGTDVVEGLGHRIFIQIIGYKPVRPFMTWNELELFLTDDLKRRFEILRNDEILVWVSAMSLYRKEILNHLESEFLNMCFEAHLKLDDALALLYHFMEKKVADTHYGDMRQLFWDEGLGGGYVGRTEGHDHRKKLAEAKERYTHAKCDNPVDKACDLMEIAREHLELYEYNEAECLLRETAKLMESVEMPFFPNQEFKMELDYLLEMKRGNNEIALTLLEKYVDACKKEHASDLMELSAIYQFSADAAEYIGHKPLAKEYKNLSHLYLEKARESVNSELECNEALQESH